jgi:hypothetical protein
MEPSLSICTKEEVREVIQFLFAEGIKPVEIIRRMQARYSDNCLSRSEIYEWIEHHFKKGRSCVCDEERLGRPSTSRIGNSIQALERRVRRCGGFHAFGPTKETLRGRTFSFDEEVIDAVQNW